MRKLISKLGLIIFMGVVVFVNTQKVLGSEGTITSISSSQINPGRILEIRGTNLQASTRNARVQIYRISAANNLISFNDLFTSYLPAAWTDKLIKIQFRDQAAFTSYSDLIDPKQKWNLKIVDNSGQLIAKWNETLQVSADVPSPVPLIPIPQRSITTQSQSPAPINQPQTSQQTQQISAITISNYPGFNPTNTTAGDVGSPTKTVPGGSSVIWTLSTLDSNPAKRIYIQETNQYFDLSNNQEIDVEGIKITAKTVKKTVRMTVTINNTDQDINLNNPTDITVRLAGTEGIAQLFRIPFVKEYSNGEVENTAFEIDYQPIPSPTPSPSPTPAETPSPSPSPSPSSTATAKCEARIETNLRNACNPPGVNIIWDLQEAYGPKTCAVYIQDLTTGAQEINQNFNCTGDTSREIIPWTGGTQIGGNDTIRLTVSNGDPNGNCYNKSTEATLSCGTSPSPSPSPAPIVCTERPDNFIQCGGTCPDGRVIPDNHLIEIHKRVDSNCNVSFTCGNDQGQVAGQCGNCTPHTEGPYPQCGGNCPQGTFGNDNLLMVTRHIDINCNPSYTCENQGSVAGQCGNPIGSSCPYPGDNCVYSNPDGQCYSGYTNDRSTCNWASDGTCLNPGAGCDYSCGPVACP